MIELLNGVTSKDFTKTMLLKYNLFVKDLSGKMKEGQYIRVAIRNELDNNKLLKAIKYEMEGK